MTHAKRVEKKKDRISRGANFWIPSAETPLFVGPILLALSPRNETHGEIPANIGAESFPPAGVNDFLPPGKIAGSLVLPG